MASDWDKAMDDIVKMIEEQSQKVFCECGFSEHDRFYAYGRLASDVVEQAAICGLPPREQAFLTTRCLLAIHQNALESQVLAMQTQAATARQIH
jgi:hypothetical protein|tara:strand:+ start:115 stop:396 length:282 start_codon:yes stop_codon:yes gene_type:complete